MSHSPHSCVRSKGFTLIEVLIAVAIGSILLTALYATFFSVFRAGSTATASLDEHIRVGRLLDLFSRDIHGAYFRKNVESTVFSGEPRGMGSKVSFTTVTYPVLKKGFPTGDLAGVSYLSEDSAAGLKVVREVWNPRMGERVRIEALDRVKSFELDYYNGSIWVKAWDSSLEKSLPVAVRATVRLADGTEFKGMARTMIKASN